jgi:hypothetical protein
LTAEEFTMKRFILIAVAVAFAAVLSGTTNLDAAPHRSVGHVAAHVHVAPAAHVAAHVHVAPAAHVAVHTPLAVHSHATLVVHGRSVHVPVHVRGYNGWGWRCWFPGYRTYGYYSGADQAWYYWYAPLNQYLPITYMSIYPPTPAGFAPVMPGQPVMPPMSPALPPGATLVPGPISAPY